MELKTLKPSMIFVFFYGIVCLIMFYSTFNFLYLMLVFNTFLATLPMVFALISLRYKKQGKRGKHMVFLLVWLLFYPNALYMVTDFIHITGNQLIYFKEVLPYEVGGGTLYSQDLMGWLKLLVIGIGAFYATLMGVVSLDQVINFFKERGKGFQGFILVLISLLTGFGVFIGRFLRFNSWDVLNPIRLIKNLVQSVDQFSGGFSLTFAAYMLVIYGIFKLILILETDNKQQVKHN